MAQKAIREYYAKQLLSKYLNLNWKFDGVLIDSENLNDLRHTINDNQKLVVKPDQLFGKRGKNGLIKIADNADEAIKWIEERIGKKVTVKKNESDKGIEGELTHFLIEPFVEHEQEYYLAIKTERDHDVIYFSEQGGIDIEENWESVTTLNIPFTIELNEKKIQMLIESKIRNLKSEIQKFIIEVYKVFKKLNFTYLEMNPFVISKDGIVPLDVVARLDSTAEYDMESLWNFEDVQVEFPKPFGSVSSEVEDQVEELDFKTSASLKLTILNPNGRIWMLIGGGGASVIFPDTVGDLGFAEELGNYGEYSGNPTQDETEAYCNFLFRAMFASKAKNKVLIIGGGIANFTDIAATFKGVIKSIQSNAEQFKKQKIKIYVRRGGINVTEGLKIIKNEVEKLGIPIEVYGPEMHMTKIVKLALNP